MKGLAFGVLRCANTPYWLAVFNLGRRRGKPVFGFPNLLSHYGGKQSVKG
jgi:hypothetical protein